MPRELDALVDLQIALKEADTARRQLSDLPDPMREIHDRHHATLETIQRLEELIESSEKERRAAESAANDANVRLAQYQEQIGRVTTQREYAALLKEIDTVKLKVGQHEEEALAILERADGAREELEQARKEFVGIDQAYQEQLVQWDRDRPGVELRLRDLEGDIDRLRRFVPVQMLKQFEMLFERLGGDVLSLATKLPPSPRGGTGSAWHCSVCNYRVRPQAIVEIKTNGALVQCERCHRFLRVEDQG